MRIVSPEFGRIDTARLRPAVLARLRRLDRHRAGTPGATVFDWGEGGRWLRVRNHVGVIRVEGLTVEILPKLAGPDLPLYDPAEADERGGGWARAQRNLVYMLSVAGHLPFRDREVAAQRVRRLPLIEALVDAFARRLLAELRRGPDRSYVGREENLSVFRGKLLTTAHVKLNAVRRDRLFVAYDDFVADTPIGRILKATCRRLLAVTARADARQRLREGVIELADVEDVGLDVRSFDAVHYTRNSERFSPLVDFARLVVDGMTPVPGVGDRETFSLLFPMEQVFEAFVGRMIRRHAPELGLDASAVLLQARGGTKWLVHEGGVRGRFQLRPDVLIRADRRRARTILDTKWKRLKPDDADVKVGVAQSDMYQLFAYAHRFECPDNVLLYPSPGDGAIVRRRYHIRGDGDDKVIRVETLDVSRDLCADRSAVVAELRRAIWPAIGPQGGVAPR
ncbi:MAG TPA: hypothetical protein VEA69_03865 [Tepidisphaeraceae bacterium]|nr:hypothetical protein [Tepidisphaeraceae bacterium]